MSILKIICYPDKKLRIKAKPIININSIKKIIYDMFDTMYNKNGIGLAATQVNIHKRIIIIDISKNKNKPFIIINPIIINRYGLINSEEKCLSIPKVKSSIKRYENIYIKALDKNGNLFKLKTKGLLSICIQHEIDHLNGKLFIDYLSDFKKNRIKKKIKKLNKLKYIL